MQLGAIAQHLDARAVHAADDGPAGARTKVAAGDAGLAVQRFAQRGLAAAHQFIPFQHGGGGGHVAGAQLQAAGRHGDCRQTGRSVSRRSGRGCSLRLGGNAGARQRQQGRQGHRVERRACTAGSKAAGSKAVGRKGVGHGGGLQHGMRGAGGANAPAHADPRPGRGLMNKTAASDSEICASSYENRSNDGRRAVLRPLAAAKSACIQRLAYRALRQQAQHRRVALQGTQRVRRLRRWGWRCAARQAAGGPRAWNSAM